MSKPHSKRTKRVLKHAREQTENARDLSKNAEYFTRRAAELSRADDNMRENFSDWEHAEDRKQEFKAAAAEAPFNMTALMKSAVREHGMPKKKKSRGAIFSREQAAKLQKARKK